MSTRRTLATLLLIASLLGTGSAQAAAPCYGKFPNPFTDVCWKCIFPLSIGPLRIEEFALEAPELR